jgi:hypothetical protein
MIDAMPGVFESAVVGVPHPDFGEAVIAAVVRRQSPDCAAATETGIVNALKGALANFKVSKRVDFIDELPPSFDFFQPPGFRQRILGCRNRQVCFFAYLLPFSKTSMAVDREGLLYAVMGLQAFGPSGGMVFLGQHLVNTFQKITPRFP